jgi:hypothetical protein
MGWFRLLQGNRCGHLPSEPRWFEPPKQHTRPKIISKAIGEIRRYYRQPASVIPSLNLANDSTRQQRSERREACLSVLGCLLHYLDLTTLRVGIPQQNQSFQGISMLFIAEKCDLTLKRTERAAADLVKSGLITVYPLCEKLSDTVYKGYAAIRTISTKLFTIFGMGGRLKFERDRAADRQRKRLKKEDTKSKAKVDLLITAKLQSNSELKPSGGRTAELKAIKAILSG